MNEEALQVISYIRAGLPGGFTPVPHKHLTPISGSPYRVLFRRNISLISGCVKFTSPFLHMLVTRSLWSNMCKSMLSVGSVRACGGEDASPSWGISFRCWEHRPGTSRCALVSHKTKKTSDATRVLLLPRSAAGCSKHEAPPLGGHTPSS